MLEKLFFLLVVWIPFQKRFHKFFRSFSESLIDPAWNLPPVFEKNIGFFITDIPLILLAFWVVRKTNICEWLQGERKYLIGFLLAALASIALSAHPSYGLYYFRWLHLALPALLFFVVTASSFTIHLRHVFLVFLCVGCFESGVAIFQYFARHSVGLKWLGEVSLTSIHNPPAQFIQPDKTLWLIDHLLGVERQENTIIRAYGTLPHPNILGGFLAMTLLASYPVFMRKRWVGIGIIFQVFALFLTYSRAALFAWIGASLIWFFLAWKRKEKVGSLFFTVVSAIGLSLILLYPQLVQRGGVVNYNAVAQGSDQGRIEYQSIALEMIRDHPFLGLGFSNYFLYAGEYAQKLGGLAYADSVVHNIYLFVAVETGIIGLCFFIAFLTRLIWSARNKLADPESAACFSIVAALLALGLCDFYLIYHQSGRLMFFLSCGLLAKSLKMVVCNVKPINSACPIGL